MAYASSASVASGSSLTQDVDTAEASTLTVLGQVGPTATAAGDITLIVVPYRENAPSPTLAGTTLPPLQANASVLAGALAQQVQLYNVNGLAKVQIQVKNNNVSALPVEVTFGINALE